MSNYIKYTIDHPVQCGEEIAWHLGRLYQQALDGNADGYELQWFDTSDRWVYIKGYIEK